MNTTMVIIRNAEPKDAPAITKVHVDTWRSAYTGILPDNVLDNLSYKEREKMWREAILNPDETAMILVAETTTCEVVGFATGGPERTREYPYQGEMYAIYVLAAFQGRGIGSELTKEVFKNLVRHSMTSMLVWVLAENPARSFYEALGGRHVAEKQLEIGGRTFLEVGYGWEDIRTLFQGDL